MPLEDLDETTRAALFRCVRAHIKLSGGALKHAQAWSIIETFCMQDMRHEWKKYLVEMAEEGNYSKNTKQSLLLIASKIP